MTHAERIELVKEIKEEYGEKVRENRQKYQPLDPIRMQTLERYFALVKVLDRIKK